MLLTQEQQMIRDMARQFAIDKLAPSAAERDRESRFPKEELQQMGELGLMGILTPEEWDGVGADYLTYALAMEEIAYGDGACSTIVGVHNSVACRPIYQFGSDYLKQEWLKPMARGERLGAFCLTEPEAGSDAAAIRSTAVKNSDGYLLNGTKQFITSGATADIAIVFAVTDKSRGRQGISAFAVPTATEGYQVTAIEKKLGQKCSDTAQIALDNLQIEAKYRLGDEGEGYRIALSQLEGGRIGIAAQAVGMARAAYEAALNYAGERKSFGKSLVQHQGVAFKLADMATRIEAARLLTHSAARLKDQGERCLKEACMAKLYATEMAEQVCSDAIQIHGGYGYLNDFPVERIYRDVRVCQIYEGTSEIQRMIIAREIAA